MVSKHLSGQQWMPLTSNLRVVRHAAVCRKLDISSSKLFDMCAKGIFPKPFTLIPGGRAVGWLEHQVDAWILERQQTTPTEAV
jgi:prophage regulatory protein